MTGIWAIVVTIGKYLRTGTNRSRYSFFLKSWQISSVATLSANFTAGKLREEI